MEDGTNEDEVSERKQKIWLLIRTDFYCFYNIIIVFCL
jgi:hypothetical protein